MEQKNDVLIFLGEVVIFCLILVETIFCFMIGTWLSTLAEEKALLLLCFVIPVFITLIGDTMLSPGEGGKIYRPSGVLYRQFVFISVISGRTRLLDSMRGDSRKS